MRLQRIPSLDAPERYFLALLRPGVERLSPPSGADIAFWDRVLELADTHRLGEFLYARRSERWWTDWPAEPRETLQRRYIETSLRNAGFESALHAILTGMRGRGISPVLLKGSALIHSVYDDPAERPFADIDLLVRRDELETACTVMSELGYLMDERYQSEAYYRAHHYHLIFRQAQQAWLCFEIHWDLAMPEMDIRLDVEGIRRRALPVEVAGEPARIPEPMDLMLHLALHASLNTFAFLGQIRDIAVLAARQEARLDPAILWQRAEAGLVAAPLAAGLSLCELFAAGPAVQRLLAANPAQRRAAPLRGLLRIETILRQRLRYSAAGAATAFVLRRDRWSERWACLKRLAHPTETALGPRGHLLDDDPLAFRRLTTRPLRAMPLRVLVVLLLAKCGWEVEPGPG